MTNTLEYVDQSVDDLNLNVISGQINEKDLKVVSEKTLEFDRGFLRIAIIGASHFFQVKFDDAEIYEVVACTKVISDSPFLYMGDITGECTVNRQINKNIKFRYSFESNILKAPSASLLQSLESEIVSQDSENYLGLSFNFLSNEQSAKTVVS